MTKSALVTGVSGQDGSYLAEFLVKKGYSVHGLLRRSSTLNVWRIDEVRDALDEEQNSRLQLHYGDLSDSGSLIRVLEAAAPDEVYNLAAQSHVKVSFELPEFTADVTGTGVARLLEAVRQYDPKTKYYQASSSEMFGSTPPPQSEATLFHPRSPYAAAKVFAHNLTVNYREAYGMHAVSGILFNHESPRRGKNFVTRKITDSVARIATGQQQGLVLGNLDARRDWGFAGDYVEAMWMMLQQDTADDYVIATGVDYSVRDFCEMAFAHVNLDWTDHVTTDERFHRPSEVDHLRGDATKANTALGWTPAVDLPQLAAMMVDSDVARVTR